MNLYISNLSYNISDEDLRLLFADYGEITSAKLLWIEKLAVQEASVSLS